MASNQERLPSYFNNLSICQRSIKIVFQVTSTCYQRASRASSTLLRHVINMASKASSTLLRHVIQHRIKSVFQVISTFYQRSIKSVFQITLTCYQRGIKIVCQVTSTCFQFINVASRSSSNYFGMLSTWHQKHLPRYFDILST